MPLDDLLARRVARAAAELCGELEVAGSVVRERAQWPGSDAEWTAAAGAAEEQLQRPVHSGVGRTTGTVWATLLDWPRTAEELLAAARRHHELSARTGVAPAAAVVDGAPPRGTVAGWTT